MVQMGEALNMYLQQLAAGVNMNCHSPIRLCTDNYRRHCKPSTSLIARCCWQPNESSAQRASGLIPCCIWCSNQAGGTVWIVWLCLLRRRLVVEGYRVTSLSSRSLEETRERCMVRVMFSKWLLPHTQPSESATQNAHDAWEWWSEWQHICVTVT